MGIKPSDFRKEEIYLTKAEADLFKKGMPAFKELEHVVSAVASVEGTHINIMDAFVRSQGGVPVNFKDASETIKLFYESLKQQELNTSKDELVHALSVVKTTVGALIPDISTIEGALGQEIHPIIDIEPRVR